MTRPNGHTITYTYHGRLNVISMYIARTMSQVQDKTGDRRFCVASVEGHYN